MRNLVDLYLLSNVRYSKLFLPIVTAELQVLSAVTHPEAAPMMKIVTVVTRTVYRNIPLIHLRLYLKAQVT